MLRIAHVLGSRLEPAFSEKIGILEHQNAVDEVEIPSAELDQQELVATTRAGIELAIALPRHERLFDGAVLLFEDERAIVVRSAHQRWLQLEPRSIADAVALGYHIGNLHWRVRFCGEVLFVAIEGRPENYAARLGELIWSRRVGMKVVGEEEMSRMTASAVGVGPNAAGAF